MDRNFFEFWGQLFLDVAKGEKQREEMNALIRHGLEGYESMRAIFRHVYGLNALPDDLPNNNALWEKATQNFQASFRQVMSIWGLVPKEDYDTLFRKCDVLEKKTAEQEQTIRHLKILLGERQDDAFAATQELQNLLVSQQDEFQRLMTSLGLFSQERQGPELPAKKVHKR